MERKLVETALESNQNGCSICQREFEAGLGLSVTGYPYNSYPDLVCRRCKSKALNEKGEAARQVWSDNPVFIEGVKCWFRGHSYMRDFWDCHSWQEFARYNQSRFGW